jgi:hypothetical protein
LKDGGNAEKAVVALSDIVKVGKDVAWDILKANESVVNIDTDYASAVPKGVPFENLGFWSLAPRLVPLRYSKTRWKRTLADILFGCYWYFGGSLDGAGKFIHNARVEIMSGDFGFGQVVDVSVNAGQPMNAAGKDDPIALLPMGFRIRHKDYLLPRVRSARLTLRGDGGHTLEPGSSVKEDPGPGSK